MSRRDPSVALRQMRDHAREAMDLAAGKKREDLDRNRLLNLALTRLVEVIGEAAGRVPAELRTAHPEVPWTGIIGTRNRLIHGYDELNFDVLWDIVTRDLPALVPQLEKMLLEYPPAN